MSLSRRAGWTFALAGLGFIAVATLTPHPDLAEAAAATPVACLVCGDEGGVDVLLNIALFVPFAFGLRLAGVRWTTAVVCAALVSGTVESLQYTVIPGRDASLSDLVTNTSGGAIGAALANYVGLLLAPGPRAARALAAGAAVVWLGVTGGTAWLLEPWAPDAPLEGAWARRMQTLPRFTGAVRSATLSQRPLPDGPVADAGALVSQIRAGRVDIEVHALSPRSEPGRWTPIVAVLARGEPAREGPVMALYQERRDVVFESPSRAGLLLLHRPAVRVANALPRRPGLPVRLRAGVQGRTVSLAVAGPTGSGNRQVALRPTLGWSLLLPFAYAHGPAEPLLTALWVAGLLLPAGYWSSRAAIGPGGRGWALLPAAAIAGGVGLVPAIAGYPGAPWSDWLAAVVGAGFGWVLGPAAAYLEVRCASPSSGESSSS